MNATPPTGRPSPEEFAELRRKRDEAIQAAVLAACREWGWDPDETAVHVSGGHGCYCACPDGPCEHVWDGPDYVSDDRCTFSATCSLCGAAAIDHDMRVAP